MLYVIHGTDTTKIKQKAAQLTDLLLKKRPDASVIRVQKENWYDSFLEEQVPAMSLFSPKNIIILSSLLDHEEAERKLIQSLDLLKNTEHICVMVEGKLTKEEIKKLSAKAEKVEEHNLPEKKEKKESPKTFALADALIQKNKRKAFEVFQLLRADDVPAEEIHGVLWWQFKSLRLALTTSGAKEADLNPFVYSKCKAVEKMWSIEEVSKYIDTLVDMYHKAHRGGLDFMADLEALCL